MPNGQAQCHKECSSDGGITALGARDGMELGIKRGAAKRSLGKIIWCADSEDLIAGVGAEPLQMHADDRGFFVELARLGSTGLAGRISSPESQIQVSATLTYPGTIKAIHYHYRQADLWTPVVGMFQVFLHDLRRSSATFGLTNTLYVGVFRPWLILIPPGVAHGYKVLGTRPALLVYLTNRYYDPEDEGRLPYDHQDIGYDWTTQHK